MRKQQILLFVSVLICLISSRRLFAEENTSAKMQSTEPSSIKYCIDPNWAPYEFLSNGNHVGISKYYLDILAEKTELKLELIPTTTWEESYKLLQSGECIFTPFLNYSKSRAKLLSFSDIYFRAPNVLYAHFDKPLIGGFDGISNETVAIVKNYRMNDFLKENFPNIKIIPVDSEREGLISVNDGEIDLFVGSFYAANLIVQKDALINLRIVGISEQEDELRIGIIHSHQYLQKKINEAISTLTKAEHRKVYKNIQPVELVKQMDYTLATQVGAVFIGILMLFATKHYGTMKLAKKLKTKNHALECLRSALEDKNAQLAELSIRDSLTGLYNRTFLSEQIEKNIKLKSRYDTPCCLLIIDIDDFKLFNDKFGHKVGDNVLQNVTKTLQEVARDTDVVSRWGGEEFVILCPETVLSQALQLAKRIQKTLMEHQIHQVNNITCSIGISELASNSNENQLFIDADRALYQAKAKGKNCVCITSME